jgi:hypothetical protein
MKQKEIEVLDFIRYVANDGTSSSEEMTGLKRWARRLKDGLYVGGTSDILIIWSEEDGAEVLKGDK